jgi:two-component system, NarL family, nitrate/nitrite response regulator NarL
LTSLLVLGPVRVYREGVAAALARQNGAHVVAVVASAAEAVQRLADPDDTVVLADASTDAGFEAIKELRRVEPAARVVVLAAPEDDIGVIECARAGVAGFVACDAGPSEVLAAAHAVASGETAFSHRVAATLLRQVGASSVERIDRRGAGLTSREREILSLIDEGLSNKEIASRLYIEVSTVKNHVHNILEKLGARRRAEAAAWVRTGNGYRR